METAIVEEFTKGLAEIQDEVTRRDKNVSELTTRVEKLQADNAGLKVEFDKVRAATAQRGRPGVAGRTPGTVSDECAAYYGAMFIQNCARSGKLELLSQSSTIREALFKESRQILGLETKTALTTTEIPLPVGYSGELRALIADFGVVRKAMFPYPIGMGTAKPPRMGNRPQFASIAMSGTFNEGSPTITFASLESHKIGGLVRVPREIEEQSIVPIGQFLARYSAVEFARAEDTWGFLADGGSTYEQVKGVLQICIDTNSSSTPTLVTLGQSKTSPADAVLDDFRQMRLGVKTPVLATGCYYMNATWEQRLRQFKTQADPMIYNQVGPRGRPTFDGYDVIWTEVLAPYSKTVPNPNACIAIFGDLSYWWMGEHLSPRIDTSDQVFFVNDQLAVRFIEEIDFDYMDNQAASALKTAAS